MGDNTRLPRLSAVPVSDTPVESHRMNALERRASFSLALIYALRMLGLFMVLPVFTLEARHYEGGHDPTAIGLAMGLYGLVQALLQIPFGLAADRFGRKRVIVAGLLLFALGSVVAALATSVTGLAWGRALQGGGAISAAVSALLADQTRDNVRTKGMALIGASIGLMFALSLVLGPVISAWSGLSGIFWLTFLLAGAGIAIVLWWTPAEVPSPAQPPQAQQETVWQVLRLPDLARLNLGVFILYTVQLATWVAVPALLIQAGVDKSQHGWVYLPAVLLSFVVMGATLFPMERRGRLRPLFLVSIGLVMLVQMGLVWQSMGAPSLAVIGFLLFVFFCGFNVLEASQPSLASRLAPVATRGTVLGIYNTLQSLGIFTGGALGGWLAKTQGAQGLFIACACLMGLWLVVAWGMTPPHPTGAPVATDHRNP